MSSSDETLVVNAKAGLLAYLHIEATEASGFESEQRDVVVTGVSLESGEEVYRTALPRPPGAIDELSIGDATTPSFEVMGADGTAIVSRQWPTTDGLWPSRLYGIGPDGAVTWERDTSHYVFVLSNATSREYVEVAGANLPPDIVSISTGESALTTDVPPLNDASSIFSDGCSSVFAILTESDLTVFDAKTAQAYTTHGEWPSGTTNTPTGVYLDGGGVADSVFVTPGGIGWTHGPGSSTNPQVKYGRLFLENQSGLLLEVDQATGQPTSETQATLPPDGFAMEAGVLEVTGSATGGTRIKLVDTPTVCG